ncbi:MAG: protein-L-isoaspartate O-methyltransferase family protein [Cupriavidus necator]
MRQLQQVRDRYARQIVASAGSSDPHLIHAFALVERERFVGDPPWHVLGHASFLTDKTNDPRLLYEDVLISLAPERGINNGQPSLHALCMAAAGVAAGQCVVHVGAGTGYYTAVLAELVGPTGVVHAYEIEEDLAARAADNLRDWPQVQLHCASATERPLPSADIVYVSAGATHPLDSWLDALAPGGRLIFPMTTGSGTGAMLLITRKAGTAYAAEFLTRVSFVGCVGARDARTSSALAVAFMSRPIEAVRSLRRNSEPDASAWCAGAGWWLSTLD